MKIEHCGIIYELDMKTNSAKVIKYRATDIYEIVIPSVIKSWMKKFIVSAIEDEAFQYSDVRKITLPETITRIGKFAFYASKLSYIFHKSPDTLIIDKSAFSNCTELKIASFDSPVIFAGDNHFNNCYHLEEFKSWNIHGSIYNGTFSNCTRLYKFHFADDVEIHHFAFFNTNFKEVFLGEDVIIHGEIEDVLHTKNILCKENSRFLDLAYDGYSVSVVEEVFA
jgi:hypothetical protein